MSQDSVSGSGEYLVPKPGRPKTAAGANSALINYEPTERQAIFHSCPADIVLYGGAAGGGKTKALLMEAFIQMLETPGSHGILFRRSFPELEKSLILESLKLFPRSICRYNEVKHRWTIRTGRTESHLDFGFCRTENDVFQYQSAEFNFMGFDEMTHFTWFMVQYLLSRVRTSQRGVKCYVRCATNPGNIGHGWVKRYFGIGKQEAEKVWTPDPTDEDPLPLSRCFIPAKVYDNPHLMDNDPAYIRRLSMLPPTQRRMLLEGDWSSFEGRFFTELKEDQHFIDPLPIPRHWKVYRAVDYGYTAPFSCLWFAAAPDGHYYCFREVYRSGLRDKEQAALVKQLSAEAVEYSVCDPSMGAKNASGASPQENYMNGEVPLIPADNNRVSGWMALRNMLALHPDGRPILQIFRNCVNLKRELEEAVTSDKNPEDLDTTGSDHAIDAARYFAHSRPMSTKEAEADPYAGMDMATRREWTAYHKVVKSAGQPDNAAILHNFNREE